MMRRILAIVVCAALLAGAAGCSQKPEIKPTAGSGGIDVAVAAELPKKGVATRAVKSPLVSSDLGFGIDLFKRMRAGEKGNLMVSPLSVSSALAMTANGAAGKTRADMERVLRIDALGRDKANQAYADLLTRLAKDGASGTVTVANSLWVDPAAKLKSGFLGRDKDFFGAQVTSVPFGNEQAALGAINGWVAKQTRGKIPRLLDRIEPQTVLELVDAVYFKQRWEQPFFPDQTKPEPFTIGTVGGKRIRHPIQILDLPMMHTAGEFDYLETPSFQAIKLQYRGDAAMYVFLPKPDVGLGAFESSLTPEAWDRWMKALAPRRGELALPRFTIRTRSELSDPLKSMGMGSAFTHADFRDMTDADVAITRVDHTAYVSVDETGTEAAAATAVDVAALASPATAKPFVMTVDSPFFFAIRDEPTGEVLFMGGVTDPRGL